VTSFINILLFDSSGLLIKRLIRKFIIIIIYQQQLEVCSRGNSYLLLINSDAILFQRKRGRVQIFNARSIVDSGSNRMQTDVTLVIVI